MMRETSMTDRVGNMNRPPVIDPAQVPRVNSLERARDNLHRAINQYRVQLKTTTLAENRTAKEREEQNQVFKNINKYAGDLEQQNAGEGVLTLCISSLNSILLVRDDINALKFQNVMLHKEIEKLRCEKDFKGEE